MPTDDDAQPDHGRRSDVVGTSMPLLVSLVVSGVGGLVFSALAAHRVDSDVVGVQATLFFWVMFVNQITSLGLSVVVSRVPAAPTGEERPLVLWSLVLTTASSFVGAFAVAAVMRTRVRDEVLDAVQQWGAWRSLGALALSVAGLSLVLLVDLRLATLGRGRWVIGRAVMVNALRCGLLAVPAWRSDPMSLFLLNAGINALSGIVGAAVLVRWTSLRSAGALVPVAPVVRDELRFGLLNWLGGLSVLLGQYGFPLVADVSPKENAAFFLAWQVTSMVFVVPVMIGYAVVVAIRGAGARNEAAARRGLAMSVAVVAVCAALAAVAGEPVLRAVFGDDYASAGTLLPYLLLGGLPWCWLTIRLAGARGAEDRPAVLALTVPYGPAVLLLAWTMTHGRPLAGAQAWAIGNAVAALAGVAGAALLSRRRRSPTG